MKKVMIALLALAAVSPLAAEKLADFTDGMGRVSVWSPPREVTAPPKAEVVDDAEVASGKALKTALAMAKAMGFTRAGVLTCTFEQETYEDLFGEQNVICGGVVDLMKYGFETLIEAGYPPEMAYFECIHEMKLIVDLVYEGGIQKMNSVISNTAEFGEYFNGPQILPPDVKARMKESLKRIESGEFAKIFLDEIKAGSPVLLGKRKALGDHPAEVTGRKIRSLFERKG